MYVGKRGGAVLVKKVSCSVVRRDFIDAARDWKKLMVVVYNITIIIMACGVRGLVFLKYMYRIENQKRAGEIATCEAQFAAEAVPEERRDGQRRTFMYGS